MKKRLRQETILIKSFDKEYIMHLGLKINLSGIVNRGN